MIIDELKKNVLPKVIAAAYLPIIAYLALNVKMPNVTAMYDFLSGGVSQLLATVAELELLRLFPFAPAVIVWSFIGICAYLLYYSLCIVYFEIGNRLIMETTFVGNQPFPAKIDITRIKRIGLHATVVGYYILAGATTVYVSFPLSETIRTYSEGLLSHITTSQMPTYLSFLAPILPWLLVLTGFGALLDWLLSQISNVDIEFEHGDEQIRLADILRPSRWQQARARYIPGGKI